MTLERALRGFAGFFILTSLVLAYFVNPKWLWFTPLESPAIYTGMKHIRLFLIERVGLEPRPFLTGFTAFVGFNLFQSAFTPLEIAPLFNNDGCLRQPISNGVYQLVSNDVGLKKVWDEII